MNATDIKGDNSVTPCPLAPGGSTAAGQCRAGCAASAGCLGWTFHFNGNMSKIPGWRCCFKTAVTDIVPSEQTTTSGILHPSALMPASGDAVVHPPDAPASAPKQEYIYDDPGNQWRLLRIINASENVVFIEWDESYTFTGSSVTHREYYDIAADPFQVNNAWDTQPALRQAALLAEIEEYYNCRGDRTTQSTCP